MSFSLTAAWHEITDLPSIYQVTLAGGAAMLLTATVWGSWKGWHWWNVGRHVNKAQLQVIRQEAALFGVELTRQLSDLTAILYLVEKYVDGQYFWDEKDPRIEFVFHFFNGGSFGFHLQPPRGHIRYRGTQLRDTPELSEPTFLHRGKLQIVVLTQRLLPAVRDELAKQTVNFHFDKLIVPLSSVHPNGEEGPKAQLPIPPLWRAEIRNLPDSHKPDSVPVEVE